jgi:hypothetical protein
MIPRKPNDRLDAGNGAWSDVTLWNFVRAAAVANLLVATLVFVEFSGFALVNHNPEDFRLGLWLIPFVTLVIWGTTTVFYLLTMALWGILALRRRLGRPGTSLSARSAVWDDWLDRPEPHDR